MKLHVIVAPRHDLDFIIEEEFTEIKSNISVYDLVSELAQTPHLTEKSITVIVDGAVVPFADWKKYFLSEEKNHEIKFILEPEGAVVMFAFVLVAMVATFLYTMRMMHNLNSKTGTDKSGESRSIYDVNAQGNKIKLGDVIPEQFGLFKKFPDYLADAHGFYRDNEYYLDLILSQGIGYFQHNLSNIYVGATPISVLQGIQCEVCEPSADLSINGIAPEITKCWYNSTEVTSSGHTLHALTTTITNNTHLEYQSIFIEGYDLSKYRVGDLVKISGAENEWVVLPAFQDTTEHYPEQISGDWTIRCQKNYRNCFDHPHQFAVYPFKSVEMMEADAQSPLPQHTYYHIYAFQRDFYVDNNPDPVLRLLDIPANELSIAESARRWGGEEWELNSSEFSQYDHAWYISTPLSNYMLLGNNSLHEYWSSGGWIPITEYSIDGYWDANTSSSYGYENDGTVDLQTIPDNCRINCYSPSGMNAGFNVWSDIVYSGRYGSLYQQTATYSYKGTPLCYELKINSGDGTYKLWNSRIKTGAKFRVWAGYCGRVKVVKCHRKELEGKTVDIMSSGLGVSDGILMELAGVSTSESSSLRTEWIRVNKLCFSLPKIGKNIMSVFEYEQVGASLVPTGAGGNWASKYDPEFSPEEQDKDWEFIVSDGIGEVAAVQEYGFGHNCVAVRVTATPKGIWDFYNEDRGTVDDNGYYKVVAVYGENSFSADLDSPILVNSKSDLSSNNAKRLFTTPHQNHRVYNSEIMLSEKDYKGREFALDQYFKKVKIGGKWEDIPCYAPSVTKVMLHRCDSEGNLYPDWTGFWAVDSIQKNVVVENITQGFSTQDMSNSISGPYRAAPIGVDVSEIEVDLQAPGGIYRRNDQGDIEPYNVTVRIEYQRAGDLEWQHRDVTLTSNGIKKFSNGEYTSTGMDAVGVTEKFDLPKGDWYFRCYRLTEEHTDDTTHYSDVVKWTGLKSVIANPQSYDDITVLLMRFKGSETLSELSDNQISTLFTRMLPNIETDVLEPTSALAPAVKYICDHSKFASLLHIDNIVDMDAIWNVRGLDLNGTLDSDNTLLNVLSDILHIGYSELSTRADGLQIVQIGEHPNVNYDSGRWGTFTSGPTDYSFIFSPQNYSNLKIDVALPRRDDAEEIEVQYTDVETYKTATVYVHMSASQYSTIEVTDYPTSIYQEKLQLFGVTEKAQAVAMGARRLRSILRNRIKFTLTTEFDSLNCNYKDFVGLVVDEPSCGMLTAEMRHSHEPSYGNEYIIQDSISMREGYSGRVTNYSNGIIEINPPLTAEQYGGSGDVAHRPTAFFITDEEGQPHLLSIRYNDWINAKSFRATLPVTWYGSDIELPRIVSAVIIPCWVEKIKPTEKNCTVELTMYDSSIFTDDLPMREGYGVSAYGTSPYGKSY